MDEETTSKGAAHGTPEAGNTEAARPPKPVGRGGPGRGQGRKPSPNRKAIQQAKEAAAAERLADAESRATGTIVAKIEEIEREADSLATIAQVEAKIGTHALALVARLVELSEGVTVQETDRRGETKTYTRPPDRDACRYLLDRFMGRIPDRAEMLPKTEGEDDRAKLPTPEELLHQVVQMLLAMQRQQAAPGATTGVDGPVAQIEAPASQAEGDSP